MIRTGWSGWNDTLSGMAAYNYEVFELQDKSGTQRYVKRNKADCVNPQFGNDCNPFLDPIFSQKFEHSNQEKEAVFRATNPGVYAMILEASDRANNSEYVARYVVYDPNSSIELQTGENDIKALSGSPNASFKWVILSSPSQSDIALEFSWKSHFINRQQHEGGFLNTIEEYRPQLEDENVAPGVFPKTINTKYKETTKNSRPQDSIPNALGIIR